MMVPKSLYGKWVGNGHLDVSENSGSPKSSHFNRDFHYFHHPFWGKNPYFWKSRHFYPLPGNSAFGDLFGMVKFSLMTPAKAI